MSFRGATMQAGGVPRRGARRRGASRRALATAIALVVLGLVVHLFGATGHHLPATAQAPIDPVASAPMAPAGDTVAPPVFDSAAAPADSDAPEHAAVGGSDRDPDGICGSLLRPGASVAMAVHSPTPPAAGCVRSFEPPLRIGSAARLPAFWLLDAPGVLRV